MTTNTSRWIQRSVAACALIAGTACHDATTATPKPANRTSLSAVSRTQAVGTVGTAVSETPSVIVQDSAGHPVAGVLVTFAVTNGGGVIQPRAVLSGADGLASVDRWTLGSIPGRNELTARNPTGATVVFIADAVAGPPAAIRKNFGDFQSGPPGTALPGRLRVRVSDVFDNPVFGVAVTFAVEAGGGSVSSESALTDSLGVATSGDWVLGASGAQRLVARAGSLVTEPFIARIVTTPGPCAESGTLKAESMTRAQLSSVGCNVYTITVPTTGAYHFIAGSPDFDTNLQLRGGGLGEVAGNDDIAIGTTNSAFDVVLAPGSYTLFVSSSKPGGSGSFDVVYNLTSADVDGCAEAFVVRGVTLRGTAYSGCAPEADNPADRYRIYLEAGDQIEIQVLDFSYSGPNIRMIMPDGRRLEAAAGNNYLTTMVTTAPASGYYLVMVGLVYETGLQYELRIR